MAKPLQGVNWAEIKAEWQKGVSAETLGPLHGVKPTAIRSKAHRDGWKPTKTNKAVALHVNKHAEKSVAKVFTQRKDEIERQIQEEIARCTRDTIQASKAVMETVTRNAGRAGDSATLGEIATALRAGSEVWRTALGLSNSPESVVNVGIKIGDSKLT
jgi:hypothetical protein